MDTVNQVDVTRYSGTLHSRLPEMLTFWSSEQTCMNLTLAYINLNMYKPLPSQTVEKT